MQNIILIFIIVLIVFLWLISAWDALIHFSGGRVRRLEFKYRDLSKKMEEWLENKHAYETVFHLLIFLAVACLAILASEAIGRYFPALSGRENVIAASFATFAIIILAEILSEASLVRFDLHILRITMPVIKILRYTVFAPIVFCTENRDLSKKMEEWLENKHAYETVFHLLIFLAVACLAILASEAIGRYFPALSGRENVIAASFATFAIIILAEILSEASLVRFDLHILRITMPVIKILRYTVFAPIVFCTEKLRAKVEKWQVQDDDQEKTTTEDEILSLVEQDETDGEEASLEEDEKRMIKGIFDLDHTDVREIMTPRVDLIGIKLSSSIQAALDIFVESGHSRIPVYEKSVDNIRGILYAKDFLNPSSLKDKTLLQISRKPIFIPETKEVGDLLAEIQKTRNHFAVVIDEYGGTAGIVTLEDIIEEIVGEIRDEYDVNEDDTPMFVKMPDGSVVFDARTLIDDVNEIMDSHISEDEDVDTIGGFICGELGHIPRPGEELKVDGERLIVKVLQADRKRILKIRISATDAAANLS